MTLMEATGGVLDPGTSVRCITCFGTEISGKVAAFDLVRKALVVACPPAPGSKDVNNAYHVINISNLKALEVTAKSTGEDEFPVVSLDNSKIMKRVKDKIEEKKRKVASIGVGVSEEAQGLFNAIKKTIDDLYWDGKKIIAMGDVTIVEPYSVNDLQLKVGGNPNTLDHISKIVRKHYEDKKKP